METNGFWPKTKNSEVPTHIYGRGGPLGLLQVKVDPGGQNT